MAVCGCRTAGPSRAPYPHESLLSALAELKVHLRADPYREEPGRDLAGLNVYRATLDRLASVEGPAGAEFGDVVDFARGECHERLGLWTSAADAFRDCAAAGTLLAEEARLRETWARRIGAVVAAPPEGRTLADLFDALARRIDDLRALAAENPPAPYPSFVAGEIERTRRERALLMFSNRMILPEGAETALAEARKLVEENPDSLRAGENRLLLGGFHETLALDQARLADPASAAFDPAPWSERVNAAREQYRIVSQTDGDPAKPEARGRLQALDAFARRVADRAR